MVSLYCQLIIAQVRTINSIPSKFKKAVEEKLKERGYDTNGNKL